MMRYLSATHLPLAVRVTLASTAAAVLSVLLVYFVMALFVAGFPLLGRGDATDAQIESVGWLVGAAGTPAIFALLALRASYLVVRAGSQRPRSLGALVGILGALCALGITEVAYGGADSWEVPAYAALGLAAGWAGAVLAHWTLGWQNGFALATRLAGAAREPSALTRALGVGLKPLGARATALWTPPGPGWRTVAVEGADGSATCPELRVIAGWSATEPGGGRREAGDPAGSSDLALAALEKRAPLTVRVARSRPGGRGVLAIPLFAASSEPLGVLTVNLTRLPLASDLSRASPAFATTAGLALHNMILVERASRSAALEERQRFQLDIHDTIAQELTGVVKTLEAVDEGSLPPDAVDQVRIALRTARSGSVQARALIDGVTELDATALPEILTRLAERCGRETGAEIRSRVVGRARRLDRTAEVALLRVAQEALNNVRKHADAKRVEVDLTFAGTLVTLRVSDDGKGFEPSAMGNSGGRGMDGMRERAEGVGGSLFVGASPGKGTRLLAQVPTNP